MKNAIFLLVVCANFLPLAVCGVITKLSVERIQEIATKLTEFHVPTYSQNDPKPDVSTLQLGDDKLLIAKTNLSDSCRYYSFQTNDDVNKIVGGVALFGSLVEVVVDGSWNVSWYYVQRDDIPSMEKLAIK